MRLSGGKRVLMFFHWLFSVLICAGLVALVMWPDTVHHYYELLVGSFSERIVLIAGIAILAIYVLLSIAQLMLIFKRRRGDRGFIVVDSSENGRVRLAISAIEQMVRQSVNGIEGINDMKIGIKNQDDAIEIGVRASIDSGSHVPTITMNMQRAIRQFVEMNCGVAVREVSITIKSVTEAAQRKHFGRRKGSAAQAVAPEQPEEFPVKEAYKPEPVAEPAKELRAPWETPKAPEPEPAAQAPALRAPWEQPRVEPEPTYEPVSTQEDEAIAPNDDEAEYPSQDSQSDFVPPADDPIARYFAQARSNVEEESEAPESRAEDEER